MILTDSSVTWLSSEAGSPSIMKKTKAVLRQQMFSFQHKPQFAMVSQLFLTAQ